jgi:hypothetical protein
MTTTEDFDSDERIDFGHLRLVATDQDGAGLAEG